MQRRITTLAAAALLLSLLVPVSAVSAATTVHVHPGQSIQAAINAAPSGALISVDRGTYRGNLEITRSVRLIGNDAVIVPARVLTNNLCTTPGFFDGVTGICVHGALNADATAIATPVSNVSIEGFTVRNFSGPGIVAVGVAGFRAVRLVTARNGEMGMFINSVSSLSLLYNRSFDNHGDGFFLENLPEGAPRSAAIIGNISYDNLGSGIMFVNSLGGRITLNAAYGNCAGIVVAAFAGQYGSASGNVSIQLNQVTANSRWCPADGSGTPAYGGVGIALLGAQNTVVALNDVRDNVAQTGSAFPGGGIAIGTLEATPLSPASPLPTGNSVRLNQLSGNAPNDIFSDSTGAGNTVSANSCTTWNLPGAC